MRTLLAVCALTIMPLSFAQPVEVSDDFSAYPAGGDGSPTWDAPSVFWETRDGAFAFDGPSTTVFLTGQPRYERIAVEAKMTLTQAAGKDWKVAGLTLFNDGEHFWHLALVESPDADGRKHFCELAQMFDGNWPTRTHARAVSEKGGNLNWEYGRSYRLRLELTPEGIKGQVWDDQGAEVVNMAFTFTGPASKIGKAGLKASSLAGSFDDFKLTASDPVPEPARGEETFPPYEVAASSLPASEATGFFRTEQRDGRWWVIDPKGIPFLAIGTDHCRFGGHWCQELGYAPYGRNNEAKWESPEPWGGQTTDRLKSWGFNLLGAGNGGETRYKGLAHTDFVAFGSTFSSFDDICPKTTWTGFPNVFSPKWPGYCDRIARNAVVASKQDPWLFGYFLDNELEWYGKKGGEGGLFDEAMLKPADHTAKRALVDFLRGRYPTIQEFNAAWGADLPTFEAILERDTLGGANGETVQKDKIGFVRLIAEEYFKHSTAAIRKYDPNHMVIGCRFAGDAPAGIWDICGKYCDIVTFNYYGRVDLDKGTAPGHVETFTKYYEKAQKPLMITEWSFPALDSGLPCKHGAGMRVDTQAQKAECFRVYQEMFFRLPFFVGSDYFMWVDEPALGISDTFPEDSNYGLVNEQDEVYEELTQMATRVNTTAYDLHLGNFPDFGFELESTTVVNRGKKPMDVPVVVWVNGRKTAHTLHLEPGEAKPAPVTRREEPGANFVAMLLDPDRQTGESDRSDNQFVSVTWTGLGALPAGVDADACAGIAVSNQSGETVEGAVAFAPLADLPEALVNAPAIIARDLSGALLPSQREPEGVAIAVGDLAPWSCNTVLLTATDNLPRTPPANARRDTDDAWVLDNGMLQLETLKKPSGNVFDRVLLGGEPLGRYNPLVWQEIGGQNQWVRASGPSDAPPYIIHGGPVRDALTVTVTGGDADPITAVDEEGQQEARRASPVRFEVSHKVIIPPGKSYILARLGHIKNVSNRPFTLKGYFFYLNGFIGGSPEGDVPAGPNGVDVPNYYATTGGAWQDTQAGLVYGAAPLNDLISGYFWLDEGGGQHPDARRSLVEPVVLQPGETYTDADQPWVLIYGARMGENPWREMRQVAAGLDAVKTAVFAVK